MTETHAVAGPSSEQAQAAILRAADDLLLEVGYSALTIEGIAGRAEVSPQTVHRWWTTKAEVLFAAAVTGAGYELLPKPQSTSIDDLAAYIEAVVTFLTTSPAGAGYRALTGEARNDAAVAQLMASVAIFDTTASTVLNRVLARGDLSAVIPMATATAIVIGPAYYQVLDSGPVAPINARTLAVAALAALRQLQ